MSAPASLADRPRAVLSLVEDGWQSARALSLILARETGAEVRHYFKGRVDPKVLAMVTPHPGVRLIAVPRSWFRLVSWWLLWTGGMRGEWRAVILDNARTRQRLRACARRWRIPIVEAGEQFQQLAYRWDDEPLEISAMVERFRKGAAGCASLSSSTARATTPAASISSGR